MLWNAKQVLGVEQKVVDGYYRSAKQRHLSIFIKSWIERDASSDIGISFHDI